MGCSLGGWRNVLCMPIDSDFAGEHTGRKSQTGYVVQAGHGSIVWRSAQQPTVARSSAESEYIAAGEVAKEAQYLHALAGGFGIDPGCIGIGIDNRAAKRLIEDPLSSSRTKHIDIIYHHVRERVSTGQMRFQNVPTKDNVADILTKPLRENLFLRLRDKLGVHAWLDE